MRYVSFSGESHAGRGSLDCNQKRRICAGRKRMKRYMLVFRASGCAGTQGRWRLTKHILRMAGGCSVHAVHHGDAEELFGQRKESTHSYVERSIAVLHEETHCKIKV